MLGHGVKSRHRFLLACSVVCVFYLFLTSASGPHLRFFRAENRGITTESTQLLSESANARSLAKRGKCVVIGLAKGIDAELLYRFARSLRHHTSVENTDIILFLDINDAPVNSSLAWALLIYNVKILRFDPKLFAPVRSRTFDPSSYRWLLIRNWMLTQSIGHYEAVLFSDVRDSVFAGDPFLFLERADSNSSKLIPAFYAFLEAEPYPIADGGWNEGWVKDCFGDAALAEIKSRIISCSGTSMGTWNAALNYVVLMADEISKNPCERKGVDQGIHNYFLYSGKLKNSLGSTTALITVKNEDGWIGTAGRMSKFKRDRGGRLLNSKGLPYALIHQYDRHDFLKKQLSREFTWIEPSI